MRRALHQLWLNLSVQQKASVLRKAFQLEREGP